MIHSPISYTQTVESAKMAQTPWCENSAGFFNTNYCLTLRELVLHPIKLGTVPFFPILALVHLPLLKRPFPISSNHLGFLM